ncbi:MAG: ribbon-helix-helix domain-containing protein [Chloroflexota bacterium]
MTTITVRLPDQLLHELDNWAKKLNIPRSLYVRQALEHMNKEIDTQRRRERLKELSLRVRAESMKVNAEFSEIEHDPTY